MQTKKSLEQFVSELEFNDWTFKLGFKNDVPYLQIKFWDTDNMSPEDETLYEQSCRKWMLSYYMEADELMSTAWKAVQAAIEHEAREQFKWRGEPIFRPHIDPIALWELSRAGRVLKREEVRYE